SGSSTGYIVTNGSGGLRQTVASSNVTYPVGPSTSLYNPLILNNAGGTSDTYKVVVASGTPANVPSPTNAYVNDTWTVTEGTSGGSNLTVTTQWASGDEGAGFVRGSNASIGYYNGSGTSWTTIGTTISGSNPYTSSATGNFAPANITSGVAFATGNFPILAPTTQATNITFSSLTATSMTIGLTRGNGSNVAVFVKNGSGTITDPTDGTAYTASTTFGSGTQLGSSGYYCVLNGTGTSVNVTGLTLGSTYYVQAYEYNGTGALIKYYTATATNNPNNRLLALVPTVTTGAGSGSTTTTVSLNGTVSANGATATNSFDYGLTTGYGTNVSATPSTTSGQSVAISASLSSLTANTLYNYRAKATNSEGTTNGSNATFTTVSLDPSISGGNETSAQTSAATNSFTAYWTAPASQGSATYTYTVEADDDIAFGSINASYIGIASGTLTQNITGLSSGTAYYYRVKVVNAGGNSNYATSSTGITTTSTPTVVLADNGSVSAANIATSSTNNILSSFSVDVTVANATLNALAFNFTNSGLVSGDIANYKLYYSATNSFGSASAIKTVTTGLATTPINFTGLTQTITSGSTGYFWVTTDISSSPVAGHSITADALATSDLTFSGSVSASGSTSAQGTQTIITLGTVTTTSASSITGTTASSGGNVTADGGSTITERGIVYGLTSSPTIADTKVIDGATTTGSFSSGLTSLSLGTTYYIRAYVTNGVGTAYGSNVSFTTLNTPTVTTTTASAISGNSASSGGNVTSDGGDAITERGVVVSTSPSPTIANTKFTSTGTTGSYSTSLTGLSALTTYYYRAFATNSTGTSYGNELNFTTISAEPTVQATVVNFTSVGLTSMTINFTAGDGSNRIVLVKAGSAVNSNPVDATSYTANTVFGSGTQIGTGNYVVYNGTGNSVSITGLTSGITYHVAVYDFNGSGGTVNYFLTTPATGNQTTLTTNYRSIATGNWGSTSTWESFDGTSWVAATSTPTSTDGTIDIRNGHIVTVAASVSADELNINSGGQITVASGQTLTINDGNSTDLTIAGTGYLKNSGTVTLSSGATASITGTYEHNINGGTIPTATWNTGALCLVNAVTTTMPTGFSQTFYTLTYNCTGSSSLNMGMYNTTINGDFNFLNGGTTSTETGLSNAAAGAGPSNTINIMGNFNVNSSVNTNQICAHRSGTASSVTALTVNIYGNLN
ncbi:MAG: fibronectin type III domain-containing protein, partial [Bacteroidetes bacterium]|nr:fibronectin type III domain-containing protein [Bacteroidota bacterium]